MRSSVRYRALSDAFNVLGVLAVVVVVVGFDHASSLIVATAVAMALVAAIGSVMVARRRRR